MSDANQVSSSFQIDKNKIVEALYTYCKRVVYKGSEKIYNAECPICGEGKSAGRKRRLFYFIDKGYFYCHNCGRAWNEASWLREIVGPSWIGTYLRREDSKPSNLVVEAPKDFKKEDEILPPESIDISNQQETSCKQGDFEAVRLIKKALRICEKRRLFSAVNSCKHFFVTTAKTNAHKGRLIIPFYDQENNIVCFQSRSLEANQFPRYLTKLNCEKPLFGLNNIDSKIPFLFIFEGPIDSMFVKNGLAMGGSSLSELQKRQLREQVDKGFTPIFVYDNEPYNEAVVRKIANKIREGKKVFIWPSHLKEYKDLNELCIDRQIDDFDWKEIIRNADFTKQKAQILFALWKKV